MSTNARLNSRKRSWVPGLIFCAASNAIFGWAMAAETDLAAKLIDTTGVAPHLAQASGIIVNDALPKYATCFTSKNEVMSEADEAEFTTLIEEHFGAAVTLPRAVSRLNHAMSPEDLAVVDAFFENPVGKRIVAAENESKDFDEARFNKFMDAHLNSKAWDKKRLNLIEAVYDSTRAARFVSTLNGEFMVASALSAHCDTRPEALDKLQPQLDNLRSESQFIEPLMRGDLVPLVATVFRNLPNSDLEAYLEFAQSDLGEQFFDALVSATGSSLSEGTLGLRQSLLQ